MWQLAFETTARKLSVAKSLHILIRTKEVQFDPIVGLRSRFSFKKFDFNRFLILIYMKHFNKCKHID